MTSLQVGQVTSDSEPGSHPLFVLYCGRSRASRYPSPPEDPFGLSRLPLGRVYCADKLEIVAPPA